MYCVTVTLTTFDKQSSGSHIEIECNHRNDRIGLYFKLSASERRQ